MRDTCVLYPMPIRSGGGRQPETRRSSREEVPIVSARRIRCEFSCWRRQCSRACRHARLRIFRSDLQNFRMLPAAHLHGDEHCSFFFPVQADGARRTGARVPFGLPALCTFVVVFEGIGVLGAIPFPARAVRRTAACLRPFLDRTND